MCTDYYLLMQFNVYCRHQGESFKDGITNGAKWYEVNGGMQDFNYMRGHIRCMDLTLEVSCTKNPAASTLESYWTQNKDAMIAYMQQVHRGVKVAARSIIKFITNFKFSCDSILFVTNTHNSLTYVRAYMNSFCRALLSMQNLMKESRRRQ